MTELLELPTVDLRLLDQADQRERLEFGCRRWGAFQLADHGISSRTYATLLREASAFFSGSQAVKNSVRRSEQNPWGFYDAELTKNTRDWKEVFDYGPAHGEHHEPRWPAAQPGLETAVMAYYRECERIAGELLRALCRNLGVPAAGLQSAFGAGHTSFVRLNYYPPCPEAAHLGVNHHTDSGAITLLLQDQHAALQIFDQGAWRLVPAEPDKLLVNLGDIFQVWSNDRYPAALHRVVSNSSHSRISAPFFFNPSNDTVYQPLPEQGAPRYRPIRWGEFRRLRSLGDYADYGAEVQISDYRITA